VLPSISTRVLLTVLLSRIRHPANVGYPPNPRSAGKKL